MATTRDYAGQIAKLLAQAEDKAVTPEEAEAFSRKAEELMIKWGISDAEVDAKRKGQRKGGEKIVQVDFVITGPWARGLNHIAFEVGRGLGVRVLKSSVRGSTMAQRIFLIGYQSDVDRAQMLYNSLVVQALAARDVWWKSGEQLTWRAGRSANEHFLAKRQFIVSFATEVGKRLVEMRDKATADVTESTALVLVDRSAKVDEELHRLYPKIGKGKATNGSMNGREAGRAAGRKARLDQSGVEGSGSKGELK